MGINKYFAIVLIFSFIILSNCTNNAIDSSATTTELAFVIHKPRAVFPEEVSVVLQGTNNNDYFNERTEDWGAAGGRMRFDDIKEGDLDVSVYGKKGGLTILEGNESISIFPGEEHKIDVELNVLLRAIHIEGVQEEQFTSDLTKLSPFWAGIPMDGAAILQLNDGADVNVSSRAAWGDNGLYMAFRIMDNTFNAFGNITNNIGEWINDAFILYLSNGLSVDDVNYDPDLGFLNGFYRLMVEVGNSDLQNSMVKLEGFYNVSSVNEESTIQNFPTNNIRVKLVQESPNTKIVEVFVPKDRINKNISGNPKIAAMFRYRNRGENINDHNLIGWKNNDDNSLDNNIMGWGNIKLVGP